MNIELTNKDKIAILINLIKTLDISIYSLEQEIAAEKTLDFISENNINELNKQISILKEKKIYMNTELQKILE